jgi:hypothetical protein
MPPSYEAQQLSLEKIVGTSIVLLMASGVSILGWMAVNISQLNTKMAVVVEKVERHDRQFGKTHSEILQNRADIKKLREQIQ